MASDCRLKPQASIICGHAYFPLTVPSSGQSLRDRNCWHFPEPHKEYDIYLSILNGGHGLGDVLEREPDSVNDDLDGGFILPRFADIHGVVATQDAGGRWSIDLAATQGRRSQLRKDRLARSQSIEEWKASQRERVESLDFIEPVRKMHKESCEFSENWAQRFKAFWDLPNDWRP